MVKPYLRLLENHQPGGGIARVFLNLQVEKRRVLQHGPILQLSSGSALPPGAHVKGTRKKSSSVDCPALLDIKL